MISFQNQILFIALMATGGAVIKAGIVHARSAQLFIAESKELL